MAHRTLGFVQRVLRTATSTRPSRYKLAAEAQNTSGHRQQEGAATAWMDSYRTLPSWTQP